MFPLPGISNKFTKRHGDNFHDTTLTAASAAKQRAERKLEKQADAIDKQQKKIETEVFALMLLSYHSTLSAIVNLHPRSC